MRRSHISPYLNILPCSWRQFQQFSQTEEANFSYKFLRNVPSAIPWHCWCSAGHLFPQFPLKTQHWAIRVTFHANHSGYSTLSPLSFPTWILFTLSTCPAALPAGVRPLLGSQSIPCVCTSPETAPSSRPRSGRWAGAVGWHTQTWIGSPSPPEPSPCSPLWEEKNHEKHHEKHPSLWFSRNTEVAMCSLGMSCSPPLPSYKTGDKDQCFHGRKSQKR